MAPQIGFEPTAFARRQTLYPLSYWGTSQSLIIRQNVSREKKEKPCQKLLHRSPFAYGDAGIGRAENGKTSIRERRMPEMSPWSKSIATRAISVKATWSSSLRRRPIAAGMSACERAAVAVGNIYLTSVSLLRSGDAVVSQLRRIGASMRAEPHRWRMRAVEATNGISQQARVQLRFRCEAGAFKWASIKREATNPCRRRMPACAHKQAKTPKALRGALPISRSRRFRHPSRRRASFAPFGRFGVALWTTPGPFRVMPWRKPVHGREGFVNRARDDGRCGQRASQGLEILDGRGFGEPSGIEHGVSAPSFFQVNTPQADKLVQLAPLDGLFELDEDCVAADLFCGVGTFTIPLAKRCGGVYAVESGGLERAQFAPHR